MIKAYLFSDITRQIDHTYYSLHGSTMGPSKFFYNLKDYKISMLSLLDPFIYEVEIYPESVVGCFDDYIEARKYKIIRNVKFVEYLNETNLSDEIAEEFNAILNGTYLDLSLIVEIRKLLKRKILNLTIYERFKFLVILNQTKIDIPLISLEENYQIYYIKLLEFYKVPYDVSIINISPQEARREKIFGNTNFETINNQTEKLLQRVRNDSAGIAHLIIGIKLTQKQFEELCDLTIDPGISFGGFKAYAIISGYKIQPQHERLFYPFIVYHYPQKIEDWIKNKILVDKTEKLIALENNYMIDGARYWNSHHQKIIGAKKIFLKEGFKIIERN